MSELCAKCKAIPARHKGLYLESIWRHPDIGVALILHAGTSADGLPIVTDWYDERRVSQYGPLALGYIFETWVHPKHG